MTVSNRLLKAITTINDPIDRVGQDHLREFVRNSESKRKSGSMATSFPLLDDLRGKRIPP